MVAALPKFLARPAGRIAFGSLVFGALLIGATPAAAVDTPWYVDVLGLESGAAEDFTGEGVTIAVIDGQINPEVPTLVGADLDIREPSFCFDGAGSSVPATSSELSATKPTDHGTNVVSTIVGSGAGYDGQNGVPGVAPAAKILYYSVYTSRDGDGEIECLDDRGISKDFLGEAMGEAIADGADIISVSLDMAAGTAFVEAMSKAAREGILVLGGLPNSSDITLSGGMPADANGAISVQAASADGQIQTTDGEPNRNPTTDIVAPGLGITVQGNPATGQWSDQFLADGTSLATPITAGIIALAMEKYPEATGNQMIQSLISNTGDAPGVPQAYDPNELIGYGLVSVENLMADDPTKYDDVNPLILEVAPDRGVFIPTYDEIFPPESADPGPSDNAGAPDEAETPSGISGWVWVVIGSALALVLIAAGVAIVLLRKRRASSRTIH